MVNAYFKPEGQRGAKGGGRSSVNHNSLFEATATRKHIAGCGDEIALMMVEAEQSSYPMRAARMQESDAYPYGFGLRSGSWHYDMLDLRGVV
jgi:hypothetical protein